MELIRFDITNAKSEGVGRGRRQAPKLILRGGYFIINRAGAELMKLKDADTVTLFQHPKHKDQWFIGQDETGFPVKERPKMGMTFSTSIAAAAIFDSVACPKSWGLHFIISEKSAFEGTFSLIDKEVVPSKTEE